MGTQSIYSYFSTNNRKIWRPSYAVDQMLFIIVLWSSTATQRQRNLCISEGRETTGTG